MVTFESPSAANYWEIRVTCDITKTIPLYSLLLRNPSYHFRNLTSSFI